MRAIVQRIRSASVTVEGQTVGCCGKGLLVLLGAHASDTDAEATKMADKVFGLRIFNDAEGKMNHSLRELLTKALSLFSRSEMGEGDGGEGSGNPKSKIQNHKSKISKRGSGVLAISNFTVYGDTAKNRRPSFVEAAPYEMGKALFDRFVEELRSLGCPVETGVFGAHMDVELINDGPVTLVIDVDAKK